MTLQRRTTSNQLWDNVVYVNVEMYKFEQSRINIFYFKVDLNNVRQREENVVIFNVDFHKGQHWENNFFFWKKQVKDNIIFLSFKEYPGLEQNSKHKNMFHVKRKKCKKKKW